MLSSEKDCGRRWGNRAAANLLGKERKAVQSELRRQITWIVIIAIAASLIVLASYRRHELDILRKHIAFGPPDQRLRAVQILVEKERLADALQEQPRWIQDKVVACIARIATPQALFQLTGSMYLLDDPVAARAKQVLVGMREVAIGPLVKALKDKDPNVRSGATDPLVAIGEPVIPSLMKLLDAWDQYVRDGVVTVFGKIGEPVTDELIKVIQRTEPLPDQTAQRFLWARDTAVRSLLAMKVPAIDPIIKNLIRFHDAEVRGLACDMLGTIADQGAATPIDEEDARRVIGPLLDRLDNDPAWTVRRKAAIALGKLRELAAKEGVVPRLIAHLSDARPEVKAAAAEALGNIGDPSAAGPLVATLINNRHGAVREIVIALEKIGAPAIQPLTAALKHPEAEVRKAATEAIATIGTPASVVPLASMLNDPDVTIRRIAADALTSLADARVVPQLIAALNDPDWHVYYAARDALVNVGAAAVPALINALASPNPRVAHMAEQALSRIGKPAVAQLAAALASPNPSVRRWAGIALGDIGPDAVKACAAVLLDTSKPAAARAAAATALGRTGSPAALEPLKQAAAKQEPEVKIAAIRALVQLGQEGATETLVNALRDPNPKVRSVAMHALMQWRLGDVDKLLEKVAREGDTNARRRAAIVLAFHTSGAAHELLRQVAAEVVYEKRAATVPVASLLLEAAGDPKEDLEVRRWAVRALGYIGDMEHVQALSKLLEPGNPLVDEAARAIARIGWRMVQRQLRTEMVSVRREPSQAAKVLIDLLVKAPNDRLRLQAAVALSMMGEDPVWGLIDQFTKVDEKLRPWIAATLAAIGKPASDACLDARGQAGENKLLRDWVTATLALIGDAQAQDLLRHLPPEQLPPKKLERSAKPILERIRKERAQVV